MDDIIINTPMDGRIFFILKGVSGPAMCVLLMMDVM